MGQKHLAVRIRPPRVVVLLDDAAPPSDLFRVIRFLSQLWGGRYFPILTVDGEQPDPLTAFRLECQRPEFVFGLGLNNDRWEPTVHEACQPRRYAPLTAELAKDVRRAQYEEFIRADRAIIAMFVARSTHLRQERSVHLVDAPVETLSSILTAAVFGAHHPNLDSRFSNEATSFTAGTPADFIDLCTDFIDDLDVSWLEMASYGLRPCLTGSPSCDPTIILVQDAVQDLSLFWNLRTAGEADHLPWIIPIRSQDAENEDTCLAIKKWLAAFDKYGSRPNYCKVSSQTVSEDECRQFANMLRPMLQNTGIKYVDYQPPPNKLPIVIPVESEKTWEVQLDGRTVKFNPPVPSAFQPHSSECWYVDLVSDASTRRSLLDMHLPSSPIIPEILNGPCPPGFEHSRIDRFGDGVDSVNVRCKPLKDVIRFYVPLADEVIEEILRESGFEPLHDEKRNSYLPTIERFGSLHQAAEAVSGKSGKILQALRGAPQRPRQIRSTCRLGGGEISTSGYLERVEQLAGSSERTKRLARRRFREHARRDLPEDLSLESLLEFWSDRDILTRQWELGPCNRCHQRHFSPRLDIQKPLICPNCGSRMLIPERVPIAYSLAQAVKHSLQEGLIPVALTGRFLRNLTHLGFFWLPGTKYRKDDRCGDIDMIACCDGALVFSECKALVETTPDSNTWSGVVEQFLGLVEVACECKADLAVLSALVDEYPNAVIKEIEERVGDRIPTLLLTKHDLEKGRRKPDEGGWLLLRDLLPDEFPDRQVKREPPGERQIRFD